MTEIECVTETGKNTRRHTQTQTQFIEEKPEHQKRKKGNFHRYNQT